MPPPIRSYPAPRALLLGLARPRGTRAGAEPQPSYPPYLWLLAFAVSAGVALAGLLAPPDHWLHAGLHSPQFPPSVPSALLSSSSSSSSLSAPAGASPSYASGACLAAWRQEAELQPRCNGNASAGPFEAWRRAALIELVDSPGGDLTSLLAPPVGQRLRKIVRLLRRGGWPVVLVASGAGDAGGNAAADDEALLAFVSGNAPRSSSPPPDKPPFSNDPLDVALMRAWLARGSNEGRDKVTITAPPLAQSMRPASLGDALRAAAAAAPPLPPLCLLPRTLAACAGATSLSAVALAAFASLSLPLAAAPDGRRDRAPTDAVLWLRRWADGAAALSAWPRYYGPLADLPFVAPPLQHERAQTRAQSPVRILDHFRAEAARGGAGAGAAVDASIAGDVSAAPLVLCVRHALPSLQVGLCPDAGAGALTLTEAPGLALQPSAIRAVAAELWPAAADLSPSTSSPPPPPLLQPHPAPSPLHPFNALAFPSGFAALAALMLSSPSSPSAEQRGAFEGTAAALWGLGLAAVLTAPGSLCGSAIGAGYYSSAPPRGLLAEPAHPDAASYPAEMEPAGGAAVPATITVGAYLGAAAAAGLAQSAATAASDLLGATSPLARALADSDASLPPLGLSGAGACVPSRERARDVLLAVVFNSNLAAPAHLAFLRLLWAPQFPAVYFFAATADGRDRPPDGLFHCAVGPAGHAAHTCLRRAAPLALGRVGLQWAMDDVLLHLWRSERFDRRRLWMPYADFERDRDFARRWPLLSGDIDGDEGVAESVSESEGARRLREWPGWPAWPSDWSEVIGARGGLTLAGMRAWSALLPTHCFLMQAANVEALPGCRSVAFVSGAVDALFVPRALLPTWARLAAPAVVNELHQEVFLWTLALATAFEPETQTFQRKVWFGAAGVGADSKRLATNASAAVAEGFWAPYLHFGWTHPFKMASFADARALVADRLEIWYLHGRAPSAEEAARPPLPRWAEGDSPFASGWRVVRRAEGRDFE